MAEQVLEPLRAGLRRGLCGAGRACPTWGLPVRGAPRSGNDGPAHRFKGPFGEEARPDFQHGLLESLRIWKAEGLAGTTFTRKEGTKPGREVGRAGAGSSPLAQHLQGLRAPPGLGGAGGLREGIQMSAAQLHLLGRA